MRPMIAAAAARVNALSPRDRLVAASVAGVALLSALIATIVALTPPAVVPTGHVVLEALPWATVTEVRGADGTVHPLPAPAATPLLLNLPVGSYRVRLDGPPSSTGTRDITVEVTEGAVTTAPVTQFQIMTPEDYFEPYLAGAAKPEGAALDALPGVPPAGPATAPPAEAGR